MTADKNLGLDTCNNSIPSGLWQYHKRPQAHTTVKFLWTVQWISRARTSLEVMAKTQVLPLPVSDHGHPAYVTELTELNWLCVTSKQASNMRLNSWRVCQHMAYVMKLLQILNSVQFKITYLYEKLNTEASKYITITAAHYTNRWHTLHTTLLSACYRLFFHTPTHSTLLTKFWHHINAALLFYKPFCSTTYTTRNQLYNLLPSTSATYYKPTYHLPDLPKSLFQLCLSTSKYT